MFYSRGARVFAREKVPTMTFLALSMFIGLFAFGGTMLGWQDPGGQVQMGLFMAFLFGIVCGYKSGK